MKKHDSEFLAVLQERAKEQATLEASSPLPELTRPFAAVFGVHTPLVLLGVSFLFASFIALASFATIYQLYLRGILGWLVR